jgi:hypothetical protein
VHLYIVLARLAIYYKKLPDNELTFIQKELSQSNISSKYTFVIKAWNDMFPYYIISK